MSVYETVRHAVISKTVIVADYDGFTREMCPHAIGTKNGVQQAFFLQVGGGSKKGLDPDPSKNWRCIKLSTLTNVKTISGEWHTASNYAGPEPCIDQVDAEVVL